MSSDFSGLNSIQQTVDAQLGLSKAPSLRPHAREDEMAALKGAAHEFESYFISNLLKTMRETVPKGVIDNKGGAYFYSFYDEEISRLAAVSGGLGLAKMIHEYTEKNSPSPSSSHGPLPIEKPTGKEAIVPATRTRRTQGA